MGLGLAIRCEFFVLSVCSVLKHSLIGFTFSVCTCYYYYRLLRIVVRSKGRASRVRNKVEVTMIYKVLNYSAEYRRYLPDS